MPTANENCGNCYFMKPQIYTDELGKRTIQPCCRFNAPPPAPVNVNPSVWHPYIAVWPPVDPIDGWCGNYKKQGP